MTKEQITADLARDGYQPFLKSAVGSVVSAEAWAHKTGSRPLVILLCRHDTGEMVDIDALPGDEDKEPDVLAFLDDFRDSVFRLQ
jgi:hypothetical protein